MSKVKTSMAKQRPVLPTVTAFERMANKLKLKPNQYLDSERLREWVERHRHSKYVPESLLKAWGLRVAVRLCDSVPPFGPQ